MKTCRRILQVRVYTSSIRAKPRNATRRVGWQANPQAIWDYLTRVGVAALVWDIFVMQECHELHPNLTKQTHLPPAASGYRAAHRCPGA